MELSDEKKERNGSSCSPGRHLWAERRTRSDCPPAVSHWHTYCSVTTVGMESGPCPLSFYFFFVFFFLLLTLLFFTEMETFFTLLFILLAHHSQHQHIFYIEFYLGQNIGHQLCARPQILHQVFLQRPQSTIARQCL